MHGFRGETAAHTYVAIVIPRMQMYRKETCLEFCVEERQLMKSEKRFPGKYPRRIVVPLRVSCRDYIML